jgi:hypothetical protein
MYPPLLNLTRFFAAPRDWDVTVYTTNCKYPLKEFEVEGVKIVRHDNPSGLSRTAAAKAYLQFNALTAAALIRERPEIVLYFEPQSSFAVTIASFFVRFAVFIHHHEYHAPEEFLRRDMRLTRLFHYIERARLFPRAIWISHTNKERLALFLRDNPSAQRAAANVLPNFPPAHWIRSNENAWRKNVPPPLRMVYVGSLSLADTYLQEFIEWIKRYPGRATLDVYAFNTDDETRRYLELNHRDHVLQFHPMGVSYDDLPNILSAYHTGVILYKAQTPNFQHNASNKLFEYLAAGLDVLYPRSMKGVSEYVRLRTNPRVIEFDFHNGDGPDINVISTRPISAPAEFGSTAESVLAKLRGAMEAILTQNA